MSSFLVFFASHLSGVWIIIANSWMQTPAGFKLEGGRAVLTNFLEAAFNPSTVVRFLHTVLGGWITGSLLVAAIGAWFLLKKKHLPQAKILFRTAFIVFAVSSFLQLGSGHAHSVQVAETQPEKMAAFEALWETTEGAPFAVFGIPDEQEEKTHLFIGIPKFLSFLIHFDFNAEVTGLDKFPKDERPPVFLPFSSYHLMILFGLLFLLFSLIGLALLFRKKIFDKRWFLKSLLFMLPLPYLANEFGWIAAEVGRQPWAVYRVLRTAEAASKVVPPGQILFSLILFLVVYTLMAVVGMAILLRMIKKGPAETGIRKTGSLT